jgi:hypothetical protein
VLRKTILAIGATSIPAGVILLLLGVAPPAGPWLIAEGVVVVLAITLEPWRYRPRTRHDDGPWQSTGERFVDPDSGKLVEVRFNPETGERKYVDAPADEKRP